MFTLHGVGLHVLYTVHSHTCISNGSYAGSMILESRFYISYLLVDVFLHARPMALRAIHRGSLPPGMSGI